MEMQSGGKKLKHCSWCPLILKAAIFDNILRRSLESSLRFIILRSVVIWPPRYINPVTFIHRNDFSFFIGFAPG